MVWLRTILAIAACALLCGCLDLSQSLDVREDGTAKLGFLIKIDSALLSLGNDKDFCTYPAPPERLQLKFTQSRGFDGEDTTCAIALDGALPNLQAYLNEKNAPQGKDDLTIAIRKEPASYSFVFKSGSIDFGTKEPDSLPGIRAMIIKASAGRAIRWSVSAPRILKTNGKLTEDGRTAHYEVPMSYLLAAAKPVELNFYAEFSTDPPSLLDRIWSWFQ